LLNYGVEEGGDSAEDVQSFSERYMAFVFFTHGNV